MGDKFIQGSKTQLLALARAIVRFEERDKPAAPVSCELPTECRRCNRSYRIEAGLEASALCHACAQLAVVEFAFLIARGPSATPRKVTRKPPSRIS
jgi:hypothetical protein